MRNPTVVILDRIAKALKVPAGVLIDDGKPPTKRPRIEAYAGEILSLIEARRDITLAEIAAHLEERHGERFAPSTVWRFLDRHDQTFKKNRARQRAGQAGRGSAPGGMARELG